MWFLDLGQQVGYHDAVNLGQETGYHVVLDLDQESDYPEVSHGFMQSQDANSDNTSNESQVRSLPHSFLFILQQYCYCNCHTIMSATKYRTKFLEFVCYITLNKSN